MDLEALDKFIANTKFYQSMDLVEGHFIKGGFDSPEEIKRLAFPEDMTGMEFLDIGCNAGYYVLASRKRGANATGIDKNKVQVKKCQELAFILGWQDRAHFMHMSLEDETWRMGPKHLISMLSVFHHLRTPYDSVRRIREICLDRFVAEIWTAESGERSMPNYGTFFKVPGYYLPTIAGAEKVLLKAGFKRVEVVGPNKTKDRIIFNAFVD